MIDTIAYFVSPTGDDENTGKLEKPFKTLEKVRDTLRLEGSKNEAIVYLRGGTYELSKTFELDSRDSGKCGNKVIYRNYPNEKAVLSGGKKINGWELYDKGKNIFRSNVGLGVDTRQLYVNGKRAIRARSMDCNGWEKKDKGYHCPDKVEFWSNLKDVEIVGRNDWKEYRGLIESVSNGEAYLQEPFWSNSQLHWPLNGIAWIENAYELLDSEGEWYLDKSEGYLYYMPLTGEAMSEIVIPSLEVLIKAVEVENIVFSGLEFSHTTWLKPNSSSGYCDVQAGCCIYGEKFHDFEASTDLWQQMDGSLQIQNSKNVVFERNTFQHIGSGAIHLGKGCKNCSIHLNTLKDISGHGIMIGNIYDDHCSESDLVAGNRVENNEISHVAREYHDCAAIFVGMTEGTIINQNWLHDLPYTGISVGWGWGTKDDPPTVQKNIKITNNFIDGFMQEMKDGGGIYSLSASPGTIISSNYLRNSKFMGPAIYLDNGSAFLVVENNVIEDVIEAFSAQNEPNFDNTIRNNYYSDDAKVNVRDTNHLLGNTAVRDKAWPIPATKIMKTCKNNAERISSMQEK